MLRKHFDKKNRNEYGLSMIELLVVIVIIGILAATAIGVTLNQRKKANDSAVESDVRNVVMAIETALVDAPNATGITAASTKGPGEITITVGDQSPKPKVSLSTGVTVKVEPAGPDGDDKFGYEVTGFHVNGSKYTEDGGKFVYDSEAGTFSK